MNFPLRKIAHSEDGIVFTFISGKKYLNLEILKDQSMVVLFTKDFRQQEEPLIWKLNSDDLQSEMLKIKQLMDNQE